GEHFNLASAPLGIRPVQKPLPKIFIAGQLQNETVQAKIAKNGYVPFIAQHHRPASALIEQRQRLEKIWQASGKHSGDLQMATQRFVFVTKNKEEEMEAAEHIRYTLRIALGLRFGTATLSGSTLNEVPAPNEPSLEDILQTAPIGSPERVAEVLSNDISTIKPSQISFIAQFGGMEQDKAMRSLDLFGSEVLPLLRKEHGDLKEKDAVSAA
ncbi:MAG: LLM class flavin-dependent oxidoreductase, partial [Salaquimonas sp.]|nr:LLM class flavin-dependent oxidoreductase [Salaquimonas sp.]